MEECSVCGAGQLDGLEFPFFEVGWCGFTRVLCECCVSPYLMALENTVAHLRREILLIKKGMGGEVRDGTD